MRTSRFMEFIITRAKLLNIYQIALLIIVPITYMLNQIITFPIFNIIINVCIFFFFFGYYTFKFLMKLFLKLLKMNSIQVKGIFSFTFSLLSGICLNVFYGTILMYLGLLQYSAYYILFECTALIFLIEEYKSILHARVEIKYKKADIIQLSFLLFPVLAVILRNAYYSPYPYFSAWDLFFYQGIAIQIAHGKIYWLYANLNPFLSAAPIPIGYTIMLSVVYISTRIPLTFLMQFDNIAIFFNYGIAILLVYLISYKISKSRFASTIIALILTSYNGAAALGPPYFLPSSFSWIINMITIYFIIIYVEAMEHPSGLRFNSLFFVSIFILLISINFFFHFFTAILIVFVLIISVFLINKKLKKVRILIYIFISLAAVYVFAGRYVNIPLISNIIISLFGTDQYWSLEMEYEFFNSNFSFLLIIIVIIGSFFILKNKKFDNYKWMIMSYLFFLIMFFMPLYATYRLQYMILIFWVCISSIIARILIDTFRKYQILNFIITFLNLISSFIFTITHEKHVKMKKKIILDKNINSKRLQVKKTHLAIVAALILFQTFNVAILTLPPENMSFNGQVGHDVSSTYSLAEYDGMQWINNIIKSDNYVFLTDFGTSYPFFGMTGQTCTFLNQNISAWSQFRFLLGNCSSLGLNVTLLSQFIINVNSYLDTTVVENHFLLLITTRTFYFLKNDEFDFSFASTSYINYTLLEYIGNTPGVNKIFNNTEVFLFNITSF